MDAEQAVKCGRGEDPDLGVWTIGLSVCFVPRSAQVELGWSQPPALRGKQRSGLTGKAECGAPSCQSSGAEAHLCVILAFDVTLRHWGGIMWLLQTKIGEQRNRWVSPCISVSKRSASYNKDAQKGPDVCACGYVYLHLTRQSYVSQCACFLGAVCGFPPDFGMLQGNLCFPKLPWLFQHRPMAVYYLFMCWSLGYNNSSNSTEKAFLFQCCDSECGMKNSFQPLQELAAVPLRSPHGILPSCSSLRSVFWDIDPPTLVMVTPGRISWEVIWSQGPSFCCWDFSTDAGIAACGGGGTRRSSAHAGNTAQALFAILVFLCLLCPSALKILCSYKSQL